MINIGYVLCLILVIFIIPTLCCAFYTMLSSTKDISDTELGESIIGNIYETIVPTTFKYGKYDTEKYNLTSWNKHITLMNPALASFDIKLKPGIKFKVIKVLVKKGIDSGTHLQIKIKLLNDIKLDMIDDYIEANIVENSKFPYPQYVNKNILESDNPNLVKIFDKELGLKTKNFKLGLYGFEFFDYEIEDIDNKNAINEKVDVIRIIE